MGSHAKPSRSLILIGTGAAGLALVTGCTAATAATNSAAASHPVRPQPSAAARHASAVAEPVATSGGGARPVPAKTARAARPVPARTAAPVPARTAAPVPARTAAPAGTATPMPARTAAPSPVRAAAPVRGANPVPVRATPVPVPTRAAR